MTNSLSDLLRSVRLTGGVFLEARFTAPWCVTACVGQIDVLPPMSSTAHLIGYHYIVEGRLLLGFEGEDFVAAEAGDIILFPRNDGHILASARGLKTVPTGDLIKSTPEGGLRRIDHGGGGAVTSLICGFLGVEDSYDPLIATLPRFLKLDLGRESSRGWIEASTRFAAGEIAQGQKASSAVMARLSELLFIEAVRQHVRAEADVEWRWLNGLKDPQIGRALALLHRDVSKCWSVDDLAREVALSRSAFRDRFTALIGMPPIRYAALYRLRTAKRQLRETGKPVAQIAYAVGYESEEAFSRAFKREFGRPPAQWRNQPDAA